MKRMNKVILAGLILAVILVSCNMPSAKSADAPDLVKTYAAQTVDVISAQGGETPVPVIPTLVPTEPPTPVPPTDEPTATYTPRATQTPLPPPIVIPCDRAAFVSDVTVPDGKIYGPGTSFVKTWRIQNNGSCTWNTGYRLVFVSGNAMSGPASVALPGNVSPGQTIDLTVNLKSPSSNGTYQGNWMLQNSSSANFGIGENGDVAFWVKIVVGTTEVSFAVTSVSISNNLTGVYSGACPPFTMVYEANITASKAGTVTYYWVDQDGTKVTSKKSITFGSGGTKTVTHSMDITGVGTHTGSLKIYIDNPNHQNFQKLTYTVVCSS